MVCTALYIKTWYDLFVKEVESLLNHDKFLEFEGSAAQKKTIFEVKTRELPYVCVSRIFDSDFHLKRVRHIAV